MTFTEQGLLQAILDNPDDDAPRLIYADWLEENGNPERAEFIRVQIELTQPDRLECRCYPELSQGVMQICRRCSLLAAQRDLLDRNGETWSQSLNDALQYGISWLYFHFDHSSCRWVRGFIHKVVCQSQSWLSNHALVRALHPIQAVQFTDLVPLTLANQKATLKHCPGGQSIPTSEIDEITSNLSGRNWRLVAALLKLNFPGIEFTLSDREFV